MVGFFEVLLRILNQIAMVSVCADLGSNPRMVCFRKWVPEL